MGNDLAAVSAANSAEILAKLEEIKQYGAEQDALTQARMEGTAWSMRALDASARGAEGTLFSIGQWNKVVNMRDENAEAKRLGLDELHPGVESDWQFYSGMEQASQEQAKKQNDMFGDVIGWEANDDPNQPSSLPGNMGDQANQAIDETEELLGLSTTIDK